MLGLPDGLFPYQKSKLCYILVGLGMKIFRIFHGILEFL
jgi:hypothetical protein